MSIHTVLIQGLRSNSSKVVLTQGKLSLQISSKGFPWWCAEAGWKAHTVVSEGALSRLLSLDSSSSFVPILESSDRKLTTKYWSLSGNRKSHSGARFAFSLAVSISSTGWKSSCVCASVSCKYHVTLASWFMEKVPRKLNSLNSDGFKQKSDGLNNWKCCKWHLTQPHNSSIQLTSGQPLAPVSPGEYVICKQYNSDFSLLAAGSQ